MHKRKLNIPHVLEALFVLIAVILFIYVFASWIDVITHNQSPEPVYQPWNLFVRYL